MKRSWLTGYMICIWVVWSYAQQPVFTERDIGDSGLGWTVYTMLQDHRSFIWLGGENGLARYDGFRLHPIVFPGDSIRPIVSALFEDHSGKIWIGAADGSIYLTDAKGEIIPFLPDEGLPRKPITAIAQDTAGQIWLATYGEGAYVYTGTRLFNMDTQDGLGSNDIYAMVTTSTGEVWLGTDDGINICRFDQEVKGIRKLGLKDGLPDQIVTRLVSDGHDKIWIGTFDAGVAVYDLQRQTMTRPFVAEFGAAVRALTIFDRDEIWMATGDAGLWRYTMGHRGPEQLHDLTGAKHQRFTALLTDREGNIWGATNEGRLFTAFRPIETLSLDLPGDIQALFCDKEGSLWVGTQAGLYQLASGAISAEPIQYTTALNITAIYEDAWQNIWLGTIDNGLYIYQKAGGKIRHVGSVMTKGGYTIMSMAASREAIWIATLDGVVSFPADHNIYQEATPVFALLEEPWQSNLYFVFQIHVDRDDRIWFATDGQGIFCKTGNEIRHFTGNDNGEIRTVYAIHSDENQRLWLNSAQYGLVRLDGDHFSMVGRDMGLQYPNIAAMALSGRGELILMHNGGITSIRPESGNTLYYGQEAGLQGFVPGLNAITIDPAGHIYAGGGKTIIRYHASRLMHDIQPATHITRISVFDKTVDQNVPGIFAYSQNYIAFEYMGLWYQAPENVTYRYMLDGYDLQWRGSKDHMVSYSNLPPGRYTFRVQASANSIFTADESTAEFAFVIHRPWWQEWWVIVPAILLVSGSMYTLFRWREQRAERQALLEKEMAESRFSALKAQINPHFLFNSFNTLISLIDEYAGQPEVAIEYVEQLSDYYRSMLQYREKETISLEEEWQLVSHFIYLLRKRYGNYLRLHIDPAPKEGKILPLTLQILVENAVKHNVISEKYPLDVQIRISDDGGQVLVRNTRQPKSKPEPSTRFGLQSIVRRYELLNGYKVVIERDDNNFEVRVPILK